LLRKPPFALLLLLVWLAAALGLLIESWGDTALTLLDTDDAMRLTQMKAWLAGQGWFDLHQPRLQPPLGYDSHWSRLVDAGLAGLLSLFKIFVAPDLAERLMRAVWPLLWLLPTMTGMAAIAWRLAGREAALVALVLALVGVPAYQQFTPGRIDHHNVQIALTMLTVAATVWSDRYALSGIAAGLSTALCLAVGYEALPYLAVCGATFIIRFVADLKGTQALRNYVLALAYGAIVALLVGVEPTHWTRPLCDALAINAVLAIVAGSLVLAGAAQLVLIQDHSRLGIVVFAALIMIAVGIAFEPRCLAGPYAMVDPAVWPIWLSEVREMQPLWRVFEINPLTASAIMAFPAAGVFASIAIWRDPQMRHDFGVLVARMTFLAAVLTTIMAIRGYSYAIWLGMPLVAAAALKLFEVFRLRSIGGRAFGSLLLTPLALSSGAIGIASAAGFDDSDSFARSASRACFRTANYESLAALPRGLIATDVSFGPFLLALTPHSVLAAPYHRLTTGIVAAHRAFALPPDEARAVVRETKADYLAICGPRPPDGLAERDRNASLWGQLQSGAVPDWLEPVPLKDTPFRFYRVRG
jgi:hypothetical protein